MKAIYSFFFISTLLFSSNAHAQKADSLKQEAYVAHISKTLSVSESKAKQVAAIMADYKANAHKAVDDKSLSPLALRAKLDTLIAEKNSRLEKILTEQQLQKIIPTTERRQNKKTTTANP